MTATNPTLEPAGDADLWATLWRGAQRPAVAQALAALEIQAQEQIARHAPVCWASGRCCHFDAFGHRLYVTGLEIAALLGAWDPPPAAGVSPSALPALPQVIDLHAACPFQRQTLCSIHAHRPLACRLFFCQRGAEAWQHELYEHLLGSIRKLHQQEQLPYRYLEWRAGLQQALAHLPPAATTKR